MNLERTFRAREDNGTVHEICVYSSSHSTHTTWTPRSTGKDTLSPTLKTRDGNFVKIVGKGVYEITTPSIVVRATCDDPNAP